jgi:hypothetical protein
VVIFHSENEAINGLDEVLQNLGRRAVMRMLRFKASREPKHKPLIARTMGAGPVKTKTYFARGEPGFVKIGKSGQPRKRLSQLQTANPRTLEIVLLLDGDREKELHSRFNKDKIHGDWFVESDELVVFMADQSNRAENR